MGSKADESHCRKIAEAAQRFGLESVCVWVPLIKQPSTPLRLLQDYEADPRPKIYITVAGRSNALSGFTDGAVSSPVIACPPPSDAFGGADVFSSLRMPSAIAPAVVLDPANAALLAAKIAGLWEPEVRTLVIAYQKEQAEKIISDDASLSK